MFFTSLPCILHNCFLTKLIFCLAFPILNILHLANYNASLSALTSFPSSSASICFSTFLYRLTQNANQWWLITVSDNSLDPDSALHMHLPFWLMNINQGWQFTFASGWEEWSEMQRVRKLALSFLLLQWHWKQIHAPQRTCGYHGGISESRKQNTCCPSLPLLFWSQKRYLYFTVT